MVLAISRTFNGSTGAGPDGCSVLLLLGWVEDDDEDCSVLSTGPTTISIDLRSTCTTGWLLAKILVHGMVRRSSRTTPLEMS